MGFRPSSRSWPDYESRGRKPPAAIDDVPDPTVGEITQRGRLSIVAIDRQLNYGRHIIANYARAVTPCRIALDLGAGTGSDLRLVREAHPQARLFGVEWSPANQEVLRAQGITALALDLERDPLPLDDGSVDLIVTNQILEHTKEIFWILHEITRVLAQGGTLVVGVPNLAAAHNRILLALGHQPSVIRSASAHVRGFTRRDFLDLLEAGHPLGYRLRETRGSNFYPFPPRLARPLAHAMPSLAWGMFLRLEKVAPYERGFLDFPTVAELETNFFVGPAPVEE